MKYLDEKELIEILREEKYPDLEKMKNEFSKWDCTSADDALVIELKCRRKHYPTMLIEKPKFEALLARAKELDYTPLYINSTPTGIYSWDLTKVLIEWKIENKHPATTSFGARGRVPKEVGYLNIEDAEILKEY